MPEDAMDFQPDPEGPSSVMPARIQSHENALAALERNMHMAERLIDMALALTKPQDWTMFGTKPWLCRSGAEGIRRRMGISIEIIPDPDTRRQYTMFKDSDDRGDFIVCELTAKVSHPQLGSIEAFGFATTRDKFFGLQGYETIGEGKDQKTLPVWKPISEVNLEHVKMKAYTNLWVNSVTRFTGISNVSAEALEKLFGAGKIGKVAFREAEDKRDAGAVAEENKQAKRLWAICKLSCSGDDNQAKQLIAKLSSFEKDGKTVNGVTDVNKLKGFRLKRTLEDAEKGWKSFLEKNPDKKAFLGDALTEATKEGTGATSS